MNGVPASEVQLAAQIFGYDKNRVTIVGNAGQIEDNLKKLPFELNEYDRCAHG
jgi:hypothetical protein